uniref:Uncharacterized protein n=1 Tax=Rhodnius prolixus TaxID=13249 RepID=T1HL02_RHOPR
MNSSCAVSGTSSTFTVNGLLIVLVICGLQIALGLFVNGIWISWGFFLRHVSQQVRSLLQF